MSNYLDFLEQDEVQALVKSIPWFQRILPSDSMFAITDTDVFAYLLFCDKLRLNIQPGSPVPAKSGIRECLNTGKRVSALLPKEVYGVPVRSITLPIQDDKGATIGAFSIGLNVETQALLSDVSQSIASTSEEITASTYELSEKATTLSEKLIALEHVGDGIKTDIANTSKILTMVNDIAASTNLLGLNAAIESARAGEVGRGFSVVAEEIRKLATNSAESVKDINAILKNIQTNIQDMMSAIQDTSEIGKNQATTTEQVAMAIQQLSEVVVDIEEIAKHI